ncbi:MAG: hypothetical protein AAF267_14870, partial [Deinococcota bacterium]
MNAVFTQPRLKKATIIGFLVFGLYFLFSTSFAQVTNLNDTGAGSLRDAITAAAEGGTITFQAGLSGTINLTGGEIEIDENTLTIDAAGTNIILDGQNTHRIFNHIGNGTLTINDLTFQNGNAGNDDGGAIRSDRELMVTNSTFRNNTSTVNSFSPLRGGGALYAQTGISASNSTFTNNTAVRGGAMISTSGGITITSSTISDNMADFYGGGIYNSLSDVTVIDSLILNNQAGIRGGGVFALRSEAIITNSMISGNSAGGFDNSFGEYGGGLYAFFNITINDSTISGNSAVDSGGGVYGDAGITLTNSVVFGNSVTTDGGGIYSDDAITLTNSTVSGNSGGSGGGIFSDDAATLNNSLVLGNSALTAAQISAVGVITLNNSAFGFTTGESTNDSFVGFELGDVFVDPINPAAAPTDAGNYRLVDTSPALNSGDNALIPVGVVADLDGGARILA